MTGIGVIGYDGIARDLLAAPFGAHAVRDEAATIALEGHRLWISGSKAALLWFAQEARV
ncbi:MAG: hypothetical protein ACREFL_10720 [Stellaceae bacterium]